MEIWGRCCLSQQRFKSHMPKYQRHVLMVILILLINVCGVGQVKPHEHFLNRDTHTHTYRCTSFGSFWAYSEITVVQRGIVGPGCASREANNIGRNCPFTKNELPEKWDLLYGRFQAHGILRWVLYFSFWNGANYYIDFGRFNTIRFGWNSLP